jgi:hypothetical protein
MSNSHRYNPRPPRAWSRVQNPCTFTDASNNVYQSVYIPLTNQTVTLAQANYEDKLLQKGNILQYKGNSSQLTKKQKYSQLAKGFGPNRTKVFATQSQTYTNPNTTGLLRVNSTTLPFPNDLVGQPNNISGPFQYAVPNPNGCTGFSIQDGGNLVCGTFANPCTGEIIKRGATSSVICNPASASNVPGFATLCWDTKVQTWFPRQRYVMTNSGNKWPQGYKGFVSAVTPSPPTISVNAFSPGLLQLLIIPNRTDCYPVSSFNIYIDGVQYDNIPNLSKSGFLYTILYNVNTVNTNNQETNAPNSYSAAQDATVNNLLLPKLYGTTQLLSSMRSILETKLSGETNTQDELDAIPVIARYINNLNTELSRTKGLQTVDSKMKSYAGVYSKYTVSNTKFNIHATSVIETRDTIHESTHMHQNVIPFDHVNYYVNQDNNSGGDNGGGDNSGGDNGGGGGSNNLTCDYTTFNKLVASDEFTYINEQMKSLISTGDQPSDYHIDIESFNRVNMQLNNIKALIEPSCYFYNMIELYMNIWKTIYFSYSTKNSLNSINVSSEQWRQDSIILRDMTLLKEYISEINNNNRAVIANVPVASKLATIKPQYTIYHSLYGMPDNLMYDPEKMSSILSDLNIK